MTECKACSRLDDWDRDSREKKCDRCRGYIGIGHPHTCRSEYAKLCQDCAVVLSDDSALTRWVVEHGEGLRKALELWCSDLELSRLLKRSVSFLGRKWPAFKDSHDRAQCNTLHAYLDGQDITREAMRSAILTLLQRYSAACDIMAMRERSVPRVPYLRPRAVSNPRPFPLRPRTTA
jgi:hypothetical protein